MAPNICTEVSKCFYFLFYFHYKHLVGESIRCKSFIVCTTDIYRLSLIYNIITFVKNCNETIVVTCLTENIKIKTRCKLLKTGRTGVKKFSVLTSRYDSTFLFLNTGVVL